jgi:hypothetical protein
MAMDDPLPRHQADTDAVELGAAVQPREETERSDRQLGGEADAVVAVAPAGGRADLDFRTGLHLVADLVGRRLVARRFEGPGRRPESIPRPARQPLVTARTTARLAN